MLGNVNQACSFRLSIGIRNHRLRTLLSLQQMPVIRLEKQDSVGHLILDRAPANALNREFLDELSAAIDECRFDSSIKAILVRSALPQFFCTGADLKMLAAAGPDYRSAFVVQVNEVISKFERTAKIVVAAMAGHCVGGGLELALCCDFRLAAVGEYNLGLPEVTLGLLPGAGGTQRLPRLIGRQKALAMMLNGAPLGPEEAKAVGLVDELHGATDLVSAAHDFAAKFTSGPTLAIGRVKLATVLGGGMPLANGLAYEQETIGRLFASDDAAEGLNSFAEKRKPDFEGR